MKILVTGWEGFTGQHFALAAQAKGHEVLALKADLTDYESIVRDISEKKFDVVVHLAAMSFVGEADENAFYRVNVLGTCNLLKALTSYSGKLQAVLLASSANVYGNCERSPIMETETPAPLNHYAMSKLAMEHMAKTFADRLPLFFTRPFNYSGRGQADVFILPKLALHFAKRARVIELGNLDVAREFNDVRFVCEAYLRLLEKAKPSEIYNICSGQSVSLRDLIQRFTELTQHAIEIKTNPAFVRSNDIKNLYGSPEKLTATIGTLPDFTLDDTIRWMLKD